MAGQVKRLDQSQLLEHREPLGWWRQLVDAMAAIIDRYRLFPGGLVRCQIVHVHGAVESLELAHDPLSQQSAIHSRTTLASHLAERPGQIRLDDVLVRRDGLSPGEKNRGRRLAPGEILEGGP